MNIKIRNARKGDIDALTMLLTKLCSIEAGLSFDHHPRQGLNLLLGGCRKHHCIKVAEVDAQVVGMCSVQIILSATEGAWVGLVENMVVEPGFRGSGVGRALMSHIRDWARKRALMRLQLLTDRTNFSALDFYDKLGWHPTQLICLRRKM